MRSALACSIRRVSSHWGQRSFRPDEEAEAQQFDADCQYDQIENTQLTVLEAVLVFLKNTEHVESTVGIYEFLVSGHDRKDGSHREGPAEFLADRFVDTLTRRDLENVRERCRSDGLSTASINIYVGKLKAALSWCVELDLPMKILGESIGSFPKQKASHEQEPWKISTNSFQCSLRGFSGRQKRL